LIGISNIRDQQYRSAISKTDVMRDVLLAYARAHILHSAAEERIYGTGMMREFARHRYRPGPGTLYPLLHRLHGDGLLTLASETTEGRVRKYCSIARRGRAVLSALRPRLADLAEEVLPAGAGKPSSQRRRRPPGR
jgi:DNA-binding PadR family transcriptional regulator